jgi:predicted nucleotidyltransferase
VADAPRLRVGETLGLLTARGVDFVVIGGVAITLHGSALFTQDLDICFAADGENLKALGKVLVELEAKLRGAPDDVPFVPDERTLRHVGVLTLDTTHGPLDVMTNPDGAPPYETLRRNAERMDIGGFAVLVASIEDLISMKRAAGRERDRRGVEELEAIRALRARGA